MSKDSIYPSMFLLAGSTLLFVITGTTEIPLLLANYAIYGLLLHLVLSKPK